MSSLPHVSGQQKPIFCLTDFLERQEERQGRGKGKARQGAGKGEAGKARPPSGTAEDGSAQKQAANLLLSRDRRVCVCLSRHKALQIPSCLQPCRGLALGKPRMVSFLNKLSFNTRNRDDLTERERLNFCERHPP